MSPLRNISILILTLILTFQASFVTVSALTDEDTIVHSLAELEIPAEIASQEIAGIISTSENTELKLDIESLLAANREYSEQIPKTNSINQNPESNTTIESILINNRDTFDAFGDFLIGSGTGFIEGAKSTKIILDHRVRTEQKVEGTRGTVAVNMATGTIISTPTGDLIDPASIGIHSATPADRIKADAYHTKNAKPIKTKKGITPSTTNSEVFEFGIPGTHLIFSSPVTISIRMPMMSDGNIVDLAVLHAGNTLFNTSGLSLSSDTLCGIDGSASKPGSQAIVRGGKITFYTCGASSFTMNPTGGTAGSNDLRIIIGDCAQAQIYYNNLAQIVGGNPPATGCTGPSVWPILRIGKNNYGNGYNAWGTASTTSSVNGNTYTATSTMTTKAGGRTYSLVITWVHTAPNKYFTWSYKVIVPVGNSANIKLYYGMNSSVAGDDANDIGYYTNTGGQTVGVSDTIGNIVSAFRYLSGAVWTGYEADPFGTIQTNITNGANLSNVIQSSTGDLGFGVNWDFGTTANITYSGAVEWRVMPYVATNIVDLIPGIGQPIGALSAGIISQMPIILNNVGSLTSTGIHSVVLTLPPNISGPSTSFVSNGWSCGAVVGSTVTCIKTTNIAFLGNDTFSIPVIPLPAAGGTSVTFNVTISNPDDSNTANNSAFATNAIVAATPYAPGGVRSMTFWSKANGGKNCSTNGCTITSWTNSGTLGAAANAVTGLGTVLYDATNQINYNPTLYFNNASLNTNNSLNLTTRSGSVYTVTRITTGGAFLIGPQTAVTNSIDWSTTPTADKFGLFGGTTFYNGANSRIGSRAAITSSVRASDGSAINKTNGLETLTGTIVATSFSGASIGIGRSTTTNSTLANVAEVIVYPIGLPAFESSKVESYLALKYGITLDQTTSQDYFLSNNLSAWDSFAAGLMNSDIAGIVRDDISGINQPKSQSINNMGDIIVSSVGAISSDFLSLIWANDATATGSFTSTDAPSGYTRITREWQLQEKNGDIGSIKIAYPVTSVPTGASGSLYLFVDTDGVFAAGSTAYTGTLNAGNWEFTVSTNDMDYITFGQSAGDTVAPIISSISRASGSLMPIGNFPLVVTYSDTGSTINTNSFTGKIYAWDGVSAWGVTNLAPTYMTLSGAATTSTGRLTVSGLPFGKYRFDISVADTVGNTQTQSIIYYIDAIDWSISADTYDIGTLSPGPQIFGTGEMIITVRTVGVAFNLSMLATNTLTKGVETINYWNGTLGWGYDQWDGSVFLGTIISTGTTGTLANQAASINTNGLKNTYTYRVKYGSKISAEQAAGLYNGSMKMDLVASY